VNCSGYIFADVDELDGMVHTFAGFFDAVNAFFVHNHEFGTDLVDLLCKIACYFNESSTFILLKIGTRSLMLSVGWQPRTAPPKRKMEICIWKSWANS
jgi:hypothetical protein